MVAGKIAKSVPNEADEFAGHGDECFVAMNAPGKETRETTVETVLRFPTDFH